jgi:amino acid adenylation domain-containing protein
MSYGPLQIPLLERVQAAGDAVAIEHGAARITFRALDRASTALATRLAGNGAPKGGHVGVLIEDRLLVIVAALAAWKIGAVFVPLDPGSPVPHLTDLARQLDLAVVVADMGAQAAAYEMSRGTTLPLLRADRGLLDAVPDGNEHADPPAFHVDDPVYIYATSGTTGRAKAVVGRSESLLHFLNWEIDALALEAGVRVSQLTSPTHDPYLRDVLVPLLAGGTICIPPDSKVVLSGAALRGWIDASAVELIHCTPSIFRNLCNAGLDEVEFRALRWVLLAGEQLYGQDVARWYDRFGARIQLINVYGPTETTLAKFYHPLSPADARNGRICVGRPISGTTYRLIYEKIGEEGVGELAIATPYRTLGYYGDDALTTRAFVPFVNDRGESEIFYRTGDLAWHLPEGDLEIVGRVDDQVKLFGERIELDELTGHLLAHPEVQQGIVRVAARGGEERPTDLVAYYVSGQSELNEALRRHFAQSLPRSKVPRLFVRMDALPLKSNGKVDAQALPDPYAVAPATAEPGPAPGGDPIEAQLTAMWSEILGREEIGLQDVFMEIGGDSLAIMLLVAHVRDDFDIEVSLWEIFEDLTIEKLAARIRETQA